MESNPSGEYVSLFIRSGERCPVEGKWDPQIPDEPAYVFENGKVMPICRGGDVTWKYAGPVEASQRKPAVMEWLGNILERRAS